MRQILCASILLAAVVSGPLAAGAVFVHWTSLDQRVLVAGVSPALWSARTFLAYFDLLMLATVVPCLVWMCSISGRLRAEPRQ